MRRKPTAEELARMVVRKSAKKRDASRILKIIEEHDRTVIQRLHALK